jgi:hypothetical protein
MSLGAGQNLLAVNYRDITSGMLLSACQRFTPSAAIDNRYSESRLRGFDYNINTAMNLDSVRFKDVAEAVEKPDSEGWLSCRNLFQYRFF